MLRTHVSRRWRVRTLLLSGVFAVASLWCLYDGGFAYPRYNRRADAYNRLAIREKDPEAWERLAVAEGWQTEFSPKDKHRDGTVRRKTVWDVRTQFAMGTVALVAAALGFCRVYRMRGVFMAVDGDRFRTVEGVTVPLAAITALDKRRWEVKSIAVVAYELDGRPGRTVIDDWIHAGGDEVLAELERRLTPDAPQESGRPEA